MSIGTWVRAGTSPAWPALGVVAVTLFCGLLWAPDPAGLQAAEGRIELRDGSVLAGELVGVENGRLRIRTAAMGEVEVDEADVLAIRPGAAGDAAAGLGTGMFGSAAEIAAIQQQVLGDPAILGAVMALQQDPEIQAALADPELAGLVLSGNLAALQSDPRFLSLISHPAIQALVGRLGSP